MKATPKRLMDFIERLANRFPFLHGAFVGASIVLGGAFFLWPDPPQYNEIEVTVQMQQPEHIDAVRLEYLKDVGAEDELNEIRQHGIAWLSFTILHKKGYTLIKTSRLELIAEIEDRLDDPETRNIRLMLIGENSNSTWGKPGWRLSVESEYIKTYQ